MSWWVALKADGTPAWISVEDPRGATPLLVVEVQEVVEQTEDARLLERTRQLLAVEHRAREAEARVERLEAGLREAREVLAFYADEENHAVQIRFAPVTGERYGAPSLVAEDRGDRARGVLQKDTGNTEQA